jgi:hypothetical protein
MITFVPSNLNLRVSLLAQPDHAPDLQPNCCCQYCAKLKAQGIDAVAGMHGVLLHGRLLSAAEAAGWVL